MPLRIMVVDWEPAACESVKTILKALDCEVVALTDSREAKRLLELEEFSSIFLNVSMPHLSGVELTQRIRASALNAPIPIVLMAGVGDGEPAKAGMKAGATFSLGKPVTLEGVRSIVKMLRGLVESRKTGLARPLVGQSLAEVSYVPDADSQPTPAETAPAQAVPAASTPARKLRLGRAPAAILCAVVLLVYVSGDRLRGPFGKLTHPSPDGLFWLFAGGEVSFPLERLSAGIDLTRSLGLPGDPIACWMRETWWSGWSYSVALKASDGVKVILFTDHSVTKLPTAWDRNADNQSFEVVDQDGLPRLQVVRSKKFGVHWNAVLFDQDQVTIVKGKERSIKPATELTKGDYPRRIFQYPSYLHYTEREPR